MGKKGSNLRKFYRNNRIYCILMIISFLCIVTMGSSVVIYFLNQNNSSPYGHRLDDASEYDTSEDIKTLKEYFKGLETVEKSSVRVQGKIIYITVTVKDDVTNETIQNIGTESLNSISEENKNYYDIQFMFNRSSYKPYLGTKSSNSSVITWANYKFDEESSEA